MNETKISVIIPSYNHADSLPGCFESLFTQTVPVREIIVVDDGSTDNTSEIVKPYLDRVKYIYQENAGAPAARNNGFRSSTGEYVIFCDADVIMKPKMLEIMLAELEKNSDISVAYSGFVWGWKAFKGLPFSKEQLFKMNFIHSTSLVRREDFPLFDENVKRLQDWDLWLTMTKQGKMAKCVSEEPLFTVRIDGTSRIGSSWIPKIMYKLPWHLIGWAPKQVSKYKTAREILKKKHAEIV
ncbi:hypothetical protein COY25_03680 [Candidatus Uhrbacteria bacterium CG_4_10_14_0_2_um_filter_41_7]|uniref:Glycosyltransferase 2-like domain-containing protein n=1 Tax=Candidatus Uhrbacteria bacterium CG_4_9_14_3_um_filter_41_35 TaxID=1975034 RepID=A0A2M7XG83_9BACT|nr:MAG: hypothetical protein COV92_02190 [Candidatus Uhrbacteria bacterium CG11_big_fil_rev_8_21_14_0_20_41_9]PIZ53317.1 MAG: hypothetical protein COY25_03680 [Candidatus Uhrbacteria bacterium CG_4_10_14_0_2_um_filter_41_7]PJA46869.1 MAG: hypothetical protein CO173_01450 [Candidatus Uhrbacteria bacterium CG_4_9_14_3_um_filter_41_35]